MIFAGSLIAHPVDTTQNTVAGIGQLFGGIGSGLNNMGKSRDDAVASLSGEAKQKRLIATGLGVDPYTDFKPLADRLDELAGAAAVGNLAVSGAFMAVPGAAGVGRVEHVDRRHAQRHGQRLFVGPAHGHQPRQAGAARRRRSDREQPLRQPQLHARST